MTGIIYAFVSVETDDIKPKHSVPDESYNVLYNHCPMISVENERSFTEFGGKIRSMKSSDMELVVLFINYFESFLLYPVLVFYFKNLNYI